MGNGTRAGECAELHGSSICNNSVLLFPKPSGCLSDPGDDSDFAASFGSSLRIPTPYSKRLC